MSKILIAVMLIAAAAFAQEDTVVPETFVDVDSEAQLDTDLSAIFDHHSTETKFTTHAILKTITQNRADFDSDMELWGFVKKAAKAVSRGVSRVTQAVGRVASTGWKALKSGASTVWNAAKKAGGWVWKKLKILAGKLCRKAIAAVAGRAIEYLFKQATQVCVRLCIRVASWLAISGGANPASVTVAGIVGTGCAFACKSAANYLKKVMSQNQLTAARLADWICDKLGLPKAELMEFRERPHFGVHKKRKNAEFMAVAPKKPVAQPPKNIPERPHFGVHKKRI